MTVIASACAVLRLAWPSWWVFLSRSSHYIIIAEMGMLSGGVYLA
jgi:ABC-type multidrug transport system permease subunit